VFRCAREFHRELARCSTTDIRSGYSGVEGMEMPRYLIVRTFGIDEEAMPDVGRRSKEIRSGGVPRSPRRGRRGQRDKRADLPIRWSRFIWTRDGILGARFSLSLGRQGGLERWRRLNSRSIGPAGVPS
jgi:hypothetical protein